VAAALASLVVDPLPPPSDSQPGSSSSSHANTNTNPLAKSVAAKASAVIAAVETHVVEATLKVFV
jgi:hypothetical protein